MNTPTINPVLHKHLYRPLGFGKIKISSGSELIPMAAFKSFLTVDLVRSNNYLGQNRGWTKYTNEEHGLIVSGGTYKGAEYLDSLEYGNRLNNPYNNYVNVFYLFDLLTKEGKQYFFDYYKKDISKVFDKQIILVDALENKLREAKAVKLEIEREIKNYI